MISISSFDCVAACCIRSFIAFGCFGACKSKITNLFVLANGKDFWNFLIIRCFIGLQSNLGLASVEQDLIVYSLQEACICHENS